MKPMILLPAVLALALAGCGQDDTPQEREKNFGAGLGGSYKGMMDEARQSADQLNAQMQRTEEEVRERD
jgi:hypothetical protein